MSAITDAPFRVLVSVLGKRPEPRTDDQPVTLPRLPYVVLPGWGGSGPDHWQSLWQCQLDGVRVPLHDWASPRLDAWVGALDAAVVALARRDPRPPVVIAHSLGCIVVAHWAKRHRRIRAALLVAPADVENTSTAVLRGFGPVPRGRLPFATSVIASDDDPNVTSARAQTFARAWGSQFHVINRGGHLNAESGLGDWLAGRKLLKQLVTAP